MSSAAVLTPYYRKFELPWENLPEERRLLKKIATSVTAAVLVFGVVIPFLPTQPVEHNVAVDVPARLARLVIERKAPPPPPPVVIEPKEETPVETSKPEPKVEEPQPEPVVEPPKPEPRLAFVPEPVVTPPINEARERAARAGLVAMADELADLRDTSSIDDAIASRSLSNTVGAAQRNERSLLTSGSGRASGGINTAALSRNTGGQGLAGRAVSQVKSPVAAAGPARGGGGASTPSGDGRQRSRDDIELIFDKNKAAIYALYRRALRADPTLQGKLVLELTITPTGQVADCRVVSSELSAPEFEERLVKRVRLFNFGAQDVDTVTTTKPIDFFPV